jgi:uncharacterized protein (UPF0333 family)
MKMVLNKKAAIELTFNVLFAAIIGVVAFVLAFSFIMSHSNTFEQEKRVEFANSLEEIFRESFEQDNIAELFTFNKNYTFEVDCNQIAFGDGAVSFQDMVVFSPSRFSSKQLGISVERFEMPFHITNVVYLYPRKDILLYCNNCDESGTPWVYYIITNEFISARDVAKDDFLDLAIAHEGNLIPMISKTKNPITIELKNETSRNLDKALSWNRSLFDEEDILVGNLSFGQEEYPFLGKEMLMGAIFSDELEAYECNVKKLLSAYNRTLKVYEKRLWLLTFSGPLCQPIKISSQDVFRSLESSITNAYNHLSYESLYQIAWNVKELEVRANNATKYSCPSIY